MNYYAIPDIHGCYDLMMKALDTIEQRDPSAIVIFLGDYIDRGPEPVKVIRKLQEGHGDLEFVLLMGNHEEMFIEENPYHPPTIKKIQEDYSIKEAQEWMKTLKRYVIIDSNVFAHAWYDVDSGEASLWARYPDEYAFYPGSGFYLTHGHTPRKHGPITAPNRCNLDTGAYDTSRLVIARYERNKMGPCEFIEIV